METNTSYCIKNNRLYEYHNFSESEGLTRLKRSLVKRGDKFAWRKTSGFVGDSWFSEAEILTEKQAKEYEEKVINKKYLK